MLTISAVSLLFAAKILLAHILVPFRGVSDPALYNNDFSNYWIAGNLVLKGKAMAMFSGHAEYFRHMQSAFGEDYPWHAWSYPPHYLFLIAWTGLFSYSVALVLFLLASLVAFLGSVRALAGRMDLVTIAFLFPLIAHNIWAGQNGFLIAALAIFVLALRDKQPVLAGIFLGMLTIKPHLGILIPFLMLAERRWIVILSATITAGAMVTAAGLLFGWNAWAGYIQQVIPYQKQVMFYLEGTFLSMIPSAYGSFRNLGIEGQTALYFHAVLAVPAFMVSLFILFRSRDAETRTVTVLLGTVFVSPYIASYDLGIACVAFLLLARRAAQNHAVFAACLFASCAPLFMIPLGNYNMPIVPLVFIAAVALFSMHQTREQKAPKAS